MDKKSLFSKNGADPEYSKPDALEEERRQEKDRICPIFSPVLLLGLEISGRSRRGAPGKASTVTLAKKVTGSA